MTTPVKHKEYITQFTEKGEIERGRTCPSCNIFKSPQGYRCKKGTRFGKQGIIRNSKCIECESGLCKPKKKVSDYEEEINTLREEIDTLRVENAGMREIYNENQNIMDKVLSELLGVFDIDYEIAIKRVEAGEKINLKKKILSSITDESRSLGSESSRSRRM